MSAGQPNWNKLAEMGKLPKSARGKIPSLVQLDAANERIKQLEKENARLREGNGLTGLEPDPGTVKEEITQVRCEFPGCSVMTGGKSEAMAKNYMRLHMKSHDKPK